MAETTPAKPLIPPTESNVINEVLQRIDGQAITDQLLQLARIGGRSIDPTPEMPIHVAPTRLSLTKEDIGGREFIKSLMTDAGLEIDDNHPLGLIGKLEGTDSDAKPIIIMSHHDTVPDADMFDGVTGVLSGIAVARAVRETNATHKRPIWILSLTGEESARFNRALFGSDAVFNGLDDETLSSSREGDITLREAIEAIGADASITQESCLAVTNVDSVIELHVEQSENLDAKNVDIGLVEAIAAPQRFELTIGEKLEPDETVYPHSEYLSIDVHGMAGHSGATSMRLRDRADGLAPLAEIMEFLQDTDTPWNRTDSNISISVGGIQIDDQALNKIPGETRAYIRISGENLEEIRDVIVNEMKKFIPLINPDYKNAYPHYPDSPITLSTLTSDEVDEKGIVFYQAQESLTAHLVATHIAATIQHIAEEEEYANHHVVGTVGTYNVKQGQVILGVDIRGIDKVTRDRAIYRMWDIIEDPLHLSIHFARELLEGSADPVSMDAGFLAMAEATIDQNNIGSRVRMNSAAGHDAMNAAQARIPTLLMFIPSRNGAHNPNAYTSPEEIEIGARALAAIALKRANA